MESTQEVTMTVEQINNIVKNAVIEGARLVLQNQRKDVVQKRCNVEDAMKILGLKIPKGKSKSSFYEYLKDPECLITPSGKSRGYYSLKSVYDEADRLNEL